MALTRAQRDRFDAVFEEILDALPDHLHELIERVPVILEDRASRKLLSELGMDPDDDDLFGLHTGVPMTEKSVEGEAVPGEDYIMIFREPILEMAAGDARVLEHEIRVTLLHEIGHQFGLDEDDLADLGYA